jgi:hypothetical protein
MAEADVQLEDDGVVTIEVDGAVADAADEVTTAKPVTEKTPVVAKTPKQAPVDEAATALKQALESSEAGRKAAEETAQAERRRADETARLAAARDQELSGYKEKVESQELTIITTGIEAAKREMLAAKSELKAAHEAGDFDKVADAQERLSKGAAALDRQEAAKASYESGAAKRATATTEGRVEAPVQGSAFEQYVSGFAPQAQAWLRQHPECVPAAVGGNSTKNSQMMAGHYDALAQNLQQGTPDYFRVIEEHAGYRTPVSAAATVTAASAADDDAGTVAAAPAAKVAPKQRQAQPSAPVSRDAPSANGLPQKTVKLTAEQQEVALLSTTPREIIGSNGQVVRETDADYRRRAFGTYAAELVKATNEGKIGRSTH